ncbi:Trimethylguanosine synthase [Penaeus vannamei]|uniref:Trimethylguanosine synthase n=1 Tax=Penaeus vannamei TaxID=6689 RepID=A0A3R7PG59_PENVA|nr:uncharacterized protein LOC113804060 [Penaeus vannamei]ROT86083.1 Trimethylguanosine synthase [Penaeus vannamei]
MNVPTFIKTEWWGHGRAILRFSATEASRENAEATSQDKGGGIIECYVSSLIISEYTKKGPKKDAEQDEERPCGEAVEEVKTETYPPDVPIEIWQDWLIHWEAWKEVYISLSWVHKYKKLCKPDYIEWYDSYIENYPDVLPLIIEGLGEVTEDLEFLHNCPQEQEDSAMEIEAQTQEGNESKTDFSNSDKSNSNLKTNEGEEKKKLDALYDKHSEERYWIHLRRFLLLSGITKTDKLEEYFNRSANLKYSDTENYSTNMGALEEESCYNTSENSSALPTTDNNPKTVDTSPMYTNEGGFSSNKNTRKASRKSYDDSYECEEHVEKKFKSAGEEQQITNNEENENECILQTKVLEQERSDVTFDMDDVSQVKSIECKRGKKKKPKRAGLSNTSGLAWTLQILQEHSVGTNNADGNETHIENLKHPETQVDLPIDSSGTGLNDKFNKNIFPVISSSLDEKNPKAEVSPVNEEATSTKPNNCKDSTIDNTSSLGEYNSDIQTLQDSEQMVTSSEDNKNEMEKQKSEEFDGSKTPGLLKKIVGTFLMHGVKILYPVIADPLYGMIRLILPFQPSQPSVRDIAPDLNSQDLRKKWYPRRIFNMAQKKFSMWLKPVAFARMAGYGFKDLHLEEFEEYEELRESQAVYQKVEEKGPGDLHLLTLNLYDIAAESKNMTEEPSKRTHITFDEDGNPNIDETISTSVYMPADMEYNCTEEEIWDQLTQEHTRIMYKVVAISPSDVPEAVHKYWVQRYRLFLKYDKGIKLDTESWFSVTPETIAIHHAYRCRCDVVVDAFCGAGGNAIQLAATCNHVIAIDIDPEKIAMAYHNASVYGVEHRIEFIVGDFFKLAPFLKADVVYLSPPWGGTQYMQEKVYNVKALDGCINCETLISTAQKITKDIAIFLPKNSDLYQIIELAGLENCVDIEYSIMGNKVKALTAYFGDLVYC